MEKEENKPSAAAPEEKEPKEKGTEPKKDDRGFTYVENANASGLGALGRSDEGKTGNEGDTVKDVY